MDEETVERLEENDKTFGLYKEQLDALKEDLEVVIAFSGPDIVNMARQKAESGQVMSNLENPGEMDSDKVFREKCRRFAERYKRLSRG
jgi:hypothetical protein